MARLSAAAKARLGAEKAKIEAELSHYQKLIFDLRTSSSESAVVKTHKQKEYHKKVQEMNHKLTMLHAK